MLDLLYTCDVFFWGRSFVKRFALCYRTVVLSVLSCLSSVCDVGALWPNDWIDPNETWHGGRPWPRRLCVRWGPSSPTKKVTAPNQFLRHVLWPSDRLSQLLLSSCIHLLRIQATIAQSTIVACNTAHASQSPQSNTRPPGRHSQARVDCLTA